MTLLEHALAHAKEGLAVFPLRERDKRPLLDGGHTQATTDEDQIRAWWEKYPNANVGVRCGDGLAVLDVDTAKEKGGQDSLSALIKESPRAFRTRVIKTGTGGFHFYYHDVSNDVPQSVGKLGKGLDTRGGGKGYVVGVGSIHPNGQPYVLHKNEPRIVFPSVLRERLARAPKDTELPPEVEIIEGQRNNKLASLAGSMRDRGLDYEEILAALLVVNANKCQPPLEDAEVEQIARSVSRYKPERSYAEEVSAQDEFEATEEAPARVHIVDPGKDVQGSDEHIVSMILPTLNRRVLFVPSANVFVLWQGHRWVFDNRKHTGTEMIVRRELRRLGLMYEEMSSAAPKGEGKVAGEIARRCQSDGGITAVKRMIQAPLAVNNSVFDSDRWLLNTPVGAVDLRTGTIGSSEAGRLFMRSTTVAPLEMPTPRWDRFLDFFTGGDKELEAYLQRWCGYVLTGSMAEKKLLVGHGSNTHTGKSTLVRIKSSLLGNYAAEINIGALIEHRSAASASPELAELDGVRLVMATEPAAGQKWNDHLIKTTTGGDKIQARFLHANPFTYYPQFKILIVGNHEPELKFVDDAMVDRVNIFPMNRKVLRGDQIPDLDKMIVDEEGPGVLAWMLAGVAPWQQRGLDAPEAVRVRNRQYLQEEDSLGSWAAECCEVGPKTHTTSEALIASYTQWCNANAEKSVGPKTLTRELERRFQLLKTQIWVNGRNLRGLKGIRVLPRVELGTEEFPS